MKTIKLILCMCLLSINFFNLKINAYNDNSLIFLGSKFSESDISQVIIDYKDEIGEIDVIKLDELENIICYNCVYAVHLDDLKTNIELVNYTKEKLNTNLVYFIGDGPIKNIETTLGIEISIKNQVLDVNGNIILNEFIEYSTDNEFSIFGYSNNKSIPGYATNVIVNEESNENLILATIREYLGNTISKSTRSSTIEKSGNSGKIYIDVNDDTYVYSNWILYKIEDNDSSKDYYLTRVLAYISNRGAKLTIKQQGFVFDNAISVLAKLILQQPKPIH